MADLSNAVPPAWPALPEYVERAAARLPALLRAPGLDYAGLAMLREGVARRYSERGLPTTPEPGDDHERCPARDRAGAAHAAPPRADRLVVDIPSYPHAIDAFRAAGARIVPVAMPEARPNVDEWERCCASCGPSSPT